MAHANLHLAVGLGVGAAALALPVARALLRNEVNRSMTI